MGVPIEILPGRSAAIGVAGDGGAGLQCDRPSLSGSVTQRACVFCGSRVVLYPIADALHLVHGPIGCAAYTWDIRGAQSSGPQLHRNSFSTDLQELDVVYGGEKKLERALLTLIARHQPKAAFVYSTCIAGVIGDDVGAVCKQVAARTGIPVLPVASEGFKGTKKDGYRAACEAVLALIGTGDTSGIQPQSINLLGDFNIAGETWLIREYFERIGIQVVATITGDGRIDDIRRAHGAALNLVQCAGSMSHLARQLETKFGRPQLRVSFFGLEDTAAALYDTARHFGDPAMLERAQTLVRQEIGKIQPELRRIRTDLTGRNAAIYVGGAFKAFSLVRALRTLGMNTAIVGTQTGDAGDYAQLRRMCDPGTVIVDDSNPLELAKFCLEHDVDLFIGGVKERPIAYKLGIGFCDHNHERKEALAGFAGMLAFAREVHGSVCSPVWRYVPRRAGRTAPAAAPESRGKPTDGPLAGAAPTRATEAAADEFPGPTTNACKLCTPLGACLAFKGIAETVPFLHGSQGCATYIRRYLISHFREPMDIAASNFAEQSAIFGGRDALHAGLANVTRQYRPKLIGIATTCLSETIGENLPQLLHEYRETDTGGVERPLLVHVSTPSYRGTHADGFHAAVRAIVEALATARDADAERHSPAGAPLAIFPGFVSAADLRQLRELAGWFGVPVTLVPDYSETMDGGSWAEYEPLPDGGTPVVAVQALARARGAVECGRILAGEPKTAGTHLATLGVPLRRVGLPIGLRETDAFCAALAALAGVAVPPDVESARARLLDAMVDGHKYVSGRCAVVYGEEDFVIGMTSFLCEIGVRPVLCASGGRSRRLAATLRATVPELPGDTMVSEAADFSEIEAAASGLNPDLVIGHSKGYGLARRLGAPLLRCGFPIHDRLGGHRVLHVGYAGGLQLYDSLVNVLLARKQESSPIGYSYL